MVETTESLLDKLHTIIEEQKSMIAAMQKKARAFIPEGESERIFKDYENDSTPLDAEEAVIRNRIQARVLSVQHTIKTEKMIAIYDDGAVVWNTDKLMEYAKDHPEILAFCRKCAPSVHIADLDAPHANWVSPSGRWKWGIPNGE